MTWEEEQYIDEITSKAADYIKDLEQRLSTLKATIEAQEIIIKDKTAIVEAMAQPKTCDGCKHYIYDDDNTFNKQWSECILFYCETRSAGNMDDFFCPRYEPKDQQ